MKTRDRMASFWCLYKHEVYKWQSVLFILLGILIGSVIVYVHDELKGEGWTFNIIWFMAWTGIGFMIMLWLAFRAARTVRSHINKSEKTGTTEKALKRLHKGRKQS